jgi:catechol 2,3-dioxygenase-like lactoylglutathione lyase family enzyme
MISFKCALLYVKDLPRMTAFYRDGLGLRVVTDSPTWVELDVGGVALGLHAIPDAIAKDITITTPPARRADTPIKLIFETLDLDASIAHATRAGAVMDAPSPWGSCDGIDPEGNVFQLTRA